MNQTRNCSLTTMVEIADGFDNKGQVVEVGTNYNSDQKLDSVCISKTVVHSI